jgi:integrase
MPTSFSRPQKIKRRDGTESEHYYARINQNGRRTWKSTGQTTLRLAREMVESWRLQEAQGERYRTEHTVSDASNAWLKDKEARVAPRSLIAYRYHARDWDKAIGRMRLRDVEPHHLETYLQKLQAAGLGPRSLETRRKFLRGLWRWAIRQRWAAYNPAEAINPFRVPRRKVRVLEEAEEARLLEAASKEGEETYGSILCLLMSGLRRGTVAKLEWPEVDFTRGEWRIPGAKMKAREDFVGRPLAPELLEWLRARRRPAGLIFGPLDAAAFRRAAAAAGVEWLKPHDLRRGFVTRCRRRGVPMELAMFLSDHRDVAVVLDAYRAIDPADVEAAVKALFAKAPRAGEAGA